jgi:hypothetical protein
LSFDLVHLKQQQPVMTFMRDLDFHCIALTRFGSATSTFRTAHDAVNPPVLVRLLTGGRGPLSQQVPACSATLAYRKVGRRQS